MLTDQLGSELEPDASRMALDLENSAVVVAPLIPWSIAGAVPLATIGAPLTSIFASFFLYLVPALLSAGTDAGFPQTLNHHKQKMPDGANSAPLAFVILIMLLNQQGFSGHLFLAAPIPISSMGRGNICQAAAFS